jgi:hypothetical protein
MSSKKQNNDTPKSVDLIEELSEEDEYFDDSEEEYEVVTLQYTIPGTKNFVRLNHP